MSSGNCLCILIWSFLLISIQSLPLAANGTRVEEKCQPTSQSFLDSSPFFRMAPSRFQSQQILFLTEFSRFMNRHAPTMMKVSILYYYNISYISSFHQSCMKNEPQMHAGGSGVKIYLRCIDFRSLLEKSKSIRRNEHYKNSNATIRRRRLTNLMVVKSRPERWLP